MKKTLTITAISAMLIVSSLIAIAQAQSTQGQLGKDLASDIREIVQTHKADVQNFILEAKVDGAETEEAKLAIVEEHLAGLKAKIDAANATRETLIADLQDGELTREEFTMEMKGLGLQIAEAAKTMGTLGQQLGALGQSSATAIRESVAELTAGLQGVGSDMGAVGKSIAEEMSGRDLPIPAGAGKPNLP